MQINLAQFGTDLMSNACIFQLLSSKNCIFPKRTRATNWPKYHHFRTLRRRTARISRKTHAKLSHDDRSTLYEHFIQYYNIYDFVGSQKCRSASCTQMSKIHVFGVKTPHLTPKMSLKGTEMLVRSICHIFGPI